MSCRYKDRCPSSSGWCEAPAWDFSYCIPFLINAYESRKHEMVPNEYQKQAMRVSTDKCRNLSNVGLGITGEAGEVADLIKKHLYQGHELDKNYLAHELGDVVWYVALACETIGYNLEDVLRMNIEKLWMRYPDGFDPERSIHRKPEDI